MWEEGTMTFIDVLQLLGFLLRVIGVLVFGLGIGWLTAKTFRPEAQGWQLLVAVYLGLLAAFVLVGRWVAGGGTLGAFSLGVGAGLFIWGLLGIKGKEEEG
jgi:hypothetical protein